MGVKSEIRAKFEGIEGYFFYKKKFIKDLLSKK